MSGIIKEPFTYVITKNANVTSGTSMITRAPWPNGRYYRVRKIDITSSDGVGTISGFAWRFWDQDLSSSTTAAVGSASSALVYVGATVTSGAIFFSGVTPVSANKPFDQQPRVPFYAGITMATNLASSVSLELEVV